MKFVHVDPNSREVTWDRYFEYLQEVSGKLPASLQNYASNWEHYSLDGANTLHDAWLIEVSLDYRQENLTLLFIGPKHDRRHQLNYLGVSSYHIDIRAEYRHGDRDVFVHEFRLEDDGQCSHEIQFSNLGRIVVKAESIQPMVNLPI
jgi:hypothetical protein